MVIINFIKTNWKLLLILFGLGGTFTVVSVVPGIEGTKDYVNTHIESTKLKLVSATTPE